PCIDPLLTTVVRRACHQTPEACRPLCCVAISVRFFLALLGRHYVCLCAILIICTRVTFIFCVCVVPVAHHAAISWMRRASARTLILPSRRHIDTPSRLTSILCVRTAMISIQIAVARHSDTYVIHTTETFILCTFEL